MADRRSGLGTTIDTFAVHSLHSLHQAFDNDTIAQQQPPLWPSLDSSRATQFAAYGLLFLAGICCNLWVALVIGRLLRRQRTSAPRSVQLYIFALCLCDLLVLSFLLVLLVDLVYGQWVLPGSLLCKLYMCSESINKLFSPCLLTSLSSFCYFSICCSSYRQNSSGQLLTVGRCGVGVGVGGGLRLQPTSPRFALLMICVSLAAVLAMVAPVYVYSDVYYLVVHNGTELRQVLRKCILMPPESLLSVFTGYSFLAGYLGPVVLVSFFYGSVLRYLRKHPSHARGERSHRFRRVAKTSLCLVGFCLVCWTPFWILNFYTYFYPERRSGEGGRSSSVGIVIIYFVHLLPHLNCAGYPILYTFMNAGIRRDYDKAVADIRSRRRQRFTKNSSLLSVLSVTSVKGQSQHVIEHQQSKRLCQQQTTATTSAARRTPTVTIVESSITDDF